MLHTEHTIDASDENPAVETDITIKLPGGLELVINVRPETGSLDLCFDRPLPACNWWDDKGSPAPVAKTGCFDAGKPHARLSKQISVPLPISQ